MAKQFFTKEEKEKIVAAIRDAEKETSGEIKLHVERNCKGDVLARAVKIFHLLKLGNTANKNGVLFYLATNHKKFAIIGDSGINDKVPEDFWESVKEKTISHFKAGNFVDGLSEGILLAGEKLKLYFPYERGDINEISDDISINQN